MTFKELKGVVGERPFVWLCGVDNKQYISQLVGYSYLYIDNYGEVTQSTTQYSDETEVKGVIRLVDYFDDVQLADVLDWIEESDATIGPQKCSCDFSRGNWGCSCGAVVKYNPYSAWSNE